MSLVVILLLVEFVADERRVICSLSGILHLGVLILKYECHAFLEP